MVHAIMLLGILIVHDYCKYSIEAALNRPVLNPLFPDCVSERQSTGMTLCVRWHMSMRV